ncbi:hypothetical protein [Pelagerythrobacter sp.]|uniref:hypothetical protein n=1 Tax=Pelagerythrobacter sp. TaxID=2800702 RepID=UPI0035B23817
MTASAWRKRYKKFKTSVPNELRADRDLSLYAFLKKEKKAELQRAFAADEMRHRSNAKRSYYRKRQKILKSTRDPGKKRFNIKDPELLLFKIRDSYLRDSLCPLYKKRWIPIPKRLKGRNRDHIVLKDFSFSRNPHGTLVQIRDLVRISSNCLNVRLDFVDEVCDDVSPYLVLASLMPTLPPVFSGGFISAEVAAVIESVGLHDALRVYRIHKRSRSKYPILPFKMAVRNPPRRFRDKNSQLKPQNKEMVADRFCDALESWLDKYEMELTEGGAQSLINSITEALDNAERHGRPDIENSVGDWSMCGFSRLVDPSDEDQEAPRLECAFAIVNVGATIFESLTTADATIKQFVATYTNRHDDLLSPELAATVVALQDGITRVPAASGAKRGGVGLLELADLVAELGDTDQPELQSRYTILSGSSCLQVTAPYQRGERAPGTQLRELWFNETNSASSVPTESHAFTIPERFAGTVISAWFCIDPEFLRKSMKV